MLLTDGSRSSRQEVFCEKGIFKNSCNFIKKETLAQVFSCEFCEISKNTFSYRTAPVAAFVGHYHLHKKIKYFTLSINLPNCSFKVSRKLAFETAND